jgi:hypothetical protein
MQRVEVQAAARDLGRLDRAEEVADRRPDDLRHEGVGGVEEAPAEGLEQRAHAVADAERLAAGDDVDAVSFAVQAVALGAERRVDHDGDGHGRGRAAGLGERIPLLDDDDAGVPDGG